MNDDKCSFQMSHTCVLGIVYKFVLIIISYFKNLTHSLSFFIQAKGRWHNIKRLFQSQRTIQTLLPAIQICHTSGSDDAQNGIRKS